VQAFYDFTLLGTLGVFGARFDRFDRVFGCILHFHNQGWGKEGYLSLPQAHDRLQHIIEPVKLITTKNRLTRLFPIINLLFFRSSQGLCRRQLLQGRGCCGIRKNLFVDHIAVFYFQREKLEEPVATP